MEESDSDIETLGSSTNEIEEHDIDILPPMGVGPSEKGLGSPSSTEHSTEHDIDILPPMAVGPSKKELGSSSSTEHSTEHDVAILPPMGVGPRKKKLGPPKLKAEVEAFIDEICAKHPPTTPPGKDEIEEPNVDACADLIQRRLKQNRLLQSRGVDQSSICRVPQNLAIISRRATEPEKVSIGPYHRDKDEVLVKFQSYKWGFLRSLLSRTGEEENTIRAMTKAMKDLERIARKQYSQPIQMSSDDFIEMMLLDGCFIIELFQKVCRGEDSPVLKKPWFPILIRDLLKLENQIPLFVLLMLSLFNCNTSEPFVWQALKFFNLALPRSPESLESFKEQRQVSSYEDSSHLLDLFYRSYCVPEKQQASLRYHDSSYPSTRRLLPCLSYLSKLTNLCKRRSHGLPRYRPLSDQSIPCVTRLRHAGAKFRPQKADNFLDINFHKGVLEIPPMTINDFTRTVLINCVAYEQCYPRPSRKCFSEYIAFMSCLIDSSRDVTFLCDDGIISNLSYNDDHVAKLFEELGKRVVFNIRECYLKNEFRKVEAYSSSNWATLRRTYFSSPWSTISVVSAFVLLALTAIQTITAILSYKVPHS